MSFRDEGESRRDERAQASAEEAPPRTERDRARSSRVSPLLLLLALLLLVLLAVAAVLLTLQTRVGSVLREPQGGDPNGQGSEAQKRQGS